MKRIITTLAFLGVFLTTSIFSTILNAQEDVSTIKLEEPEETACRKIEEKLYLNSVLNNSVDSQYYVDSVKQCMGESPDFYLVAGKYFYNNNEYKSSIIEFKKVIELANSDREKLGEAFYYLSLASYYVNDFDNSDKYAKQALTNDFNSSWTYNLLGLAVAETGKREKALAYFDKSLKADPSNHIAASNMGWMHDQVHNDKEALKCYLYADSIVKGKKASYVSGIIFHLGQLDRKEEAYILAEKAYKKFPNDKAIIERYSSVLSRQHKYNELLPLARKLLKMHPVSAHDWFAVAYIYDLAGSVDSAFYFYKMSLKYDSRKAIAYDNIGDIYKDLGMFEKAHENLDIALSIDSNFHYFYSRKIEIYSWQHDFENSYLWSLKYKQRFPERQSDYKIGYSLQQLKRYSEAIPYLKAALSYDPNDDRLINNIGRCYAELGQKELALTYFESALKINPENSFIYHNRAALYYDMEKYDWACQDLKLAIDKEYNWIIDEKLITMKNTYCPEINTNIKVMVYEYKGNIKKLAKYDFIKLSDSLLNKFIDITLAENTELNVEREEIQTISTFNLFNLYPNPTNETFYIESLSKPNEKLTIKVYNSNGEMVMIDNMIGGDRKSFKLKGISKGIYVVVISNENSVLSTKKMIVEN